MLEMQLKQSGFTYSTCSVFTKNKEKIHKLIQTGKTNYIYRNNLDKACFQHDMTYGKYNDLNKRAESNKVLKDKPFKTGSNPKHNAYLKGLASMICKFFDKKSKGSEWY